MAEPLTWEAILVLDEAELNLAMEYWCFARKWVYKTVVSGGIMQGWFCNGHFMGLPEDSPPEASPAQHTTSWDALMPLAWRYGISLRHLRRPDGTWYWFVGLEGTQGVCPETVAEARVGIARVALWCHTHQQETPHG